MGGAGKHVEETGTGDAVPARKKCFEVTRERRRVAGNIENTAEAAGCQRLRDAGRQTVARRVDDTGRAFRCRDESGKIDAVLAKRVAVEGCLEAERGGVLACR